LFQLSHARLLACITVPAGLGIGLITITQSSLPCKPKLFKNHFMALFYGSLKIEI
jgi:hypothetical protein